MFASSTGPRSAARRRGIVLVLVLGMLGLMALIGVTFATFAGQSLKNGRNFSQGVARPQAEALMDYALAQLINDTNNPLSAIRGHSLLRDMYGNDSVYRGASPTQNTVVDLLSNGVFDRVYNNNGVAVNLLLGTPSLHNTSNVTPFYGQLQYPTNIPTTGQYHGLDFTRWTLRFNPSNSSVPSVPQTFEVLEDDATTGVHIFTLSANLGVPMTDPNGLVTPLSSGDVRSFIYGDPNLGASGTPNNFSVLASGNNPGRGYTALAREATPFILDGRYMRAFNGPGLTRPVQAVPDSNNNYVNYPYNQAAYGNMRVAGYDPDTVGMDEDYDACDLENWFLAIQSADGSVMVPSFHRPGIVTANDWLATALPSQRAKILRPRQVDNSPLFPSDPTTFTSGKANYDIDNDGDGVTDSVWLDLGFPAQRDPNGKLYKPLFAFMVLGLNGRLPLNTVGNLQARAIGDTTNNVSNDGMNTPLVTYIKSSGQVPYAGGNSNADNGSTRQHLLSSQVFFDTPLYDHASHLGYSVNEINPKFALQNAPSNVYPTGGSGDVYGISYSQYDNAGVPVALTQLRNILAGGMATDLPTPYLGSAPASGSFSTYRNNSSGFYNDDMNIVNINNSSTTPGYWVFPNGMADNSDNLVGSGVGRNMPTVPGRWGEPEALESIRFKALYVPTSYNDADPTYYMLRYANPIRAGRSFYTGSGYSNDAMDDDFDAIDPFLPNSYEKSSNTFTVAKDATNASLDTLPVGSTDSAFMTATFNRQYPEDVDRFDGAGQAAVASERIRRFVTPIDPAGVGRSVDYMKRPAGDYDYGKGADSLGRAAYFRYFRPAGMPQEVFYPYADANLNGFGYAYATSGATASNSGLGQQYLTPVLIPAGRGRGITTVNNNPSPITIIPDVRNNKLHGYQAMATPDTQNSTPDAPTVAVMGAMPYDYDSSTGTYPIGYLSTITLYSPTIQPGGALNSSINTETGPNLGAVGGNPSDTNYYGIPYVPNSSTGDFGTAGTYDATYVPSAPLVVNGYIGGSLNKDEADEMNLYVPNSHDMPYGPTDLEWLYRKHDVDGGTLNSRLSTLAPISFLNPADSLTRRRMFSTDAWDLINFSYANDNPLQYAGIMGISGPPFAGGHSSDHDFTYNSRFSPDASPSFEIMNQVVVSPTSTGTPVTFSTHFANPITTEFLFNPTLPIHTYPAKGNGTFNGDSFTSYVQNSSNSLDNGGTPITLPLTIDHMGTHPFDAAFPTATINTYTNVVYPEGTPSAAQVLTPSLAHRDRKINLNMPLPLSTDPAEPVRQKWCRETYRMLKAILPPASVDTPEELAQLSQFVVNIIDFRDPDCAMTRFVNTDLILTDALSKTSTPVPQPAALDPVMNASPMGIRFATGVDTIPTGNFPYDPSLYNPDQATPFLVQHGMEYNPIAINEAFAAQYQYSTTGVCRELFIELTNTLTESQNDSVDGGNNRPSRGNSSTIDLTGWDLIITPDDYGWGRPDPTTGDVSVVAWPPQTSTTFQTASPTTQGQASANTTLPTTSTTIQQYRFTSTAAGGNNTGSNNLVRAINGTTIGDLGIIGAYMNSSAQATTGAGQNAPPQNNNTAVESPAVASGTTIANNNQARGANAPPTFDVVLPQSFIPYSSLVTPGSGKGAYFWVYLRRPANPFDTDDLAAPRVNREMVVVDSMRFPYIDVSKLNSGSTPTIPYAAFSAARLQPNRGGHLVPAATTPPTGTSLPPGVTAIAPPTPASAYGYSEQTACYNSIGSAVTLNINQSYPYYFDANNNAQRATNYFYETIGELNSTNTTSAAKDIDTNRGLLAFNDRDFTSVAELLLVPGCPPGLFSKQFIEEPYPGHATGYSSTAANGTAANGGDLTTKAAKGWDTSKLASLTNAAAFPAVLETGLQNFGYGTTSLAGPTFPYLTDNFYYTAASVSPPATPDTNQTHLTTEVGGWTGTGWHKMMEFFEVPSSANGAIGTADLGNNYDWYRADIKPGQLNLNLIIDEEVFAGLIDDPRLNETLASTFSTIPHVVSQINYYGTPTQQYSMFSGSSINLGVANGAVGRGYVLRDPNLADYTAGGPYPIQQIHGLKAAFSDFLKLRHGASGYLFAHGAGDVSMGNVAGQPVAADRPFRSLSYPDINYTIMRPASLPPSPADTGTPQTYTGTTPALPQNLLNLFTYITANTGVGPFVQLNPTTAPRASGTLTNGTFSAPPYIQDPGIRNPFLDIQYVNTTDMATPLTPNLRRLAPPYDVSGYNTPNQILGNPPVVPPAPFPPTIPPAPARRLFQIPDTTTTLYPTSNASLAGQQDNTLNTDTNGAQYYMVNEPVKTPQLTTVAVSPPSLVPVSRAVFAADNYTPQANTVVNNYLGANSLSSDTGTNDLRMHPAYRTEMLQKISNLTTVRTHQFATWITVGFFEVVRVGTPELGIPDVLGQEVGLAAGANVRYRSFFVIDRTKATGFNPYYPGNFRDCVTFRRRIE